MLRPSRMVALMVILLGVVSALVAPEAMTQSEFTLTGEWIVTSSPINGQLFSPLGNTLGFPERDMFFEEDGDLKKGMVLREDAGPNVEPLGVWRIQGDRFSASFQLWCPEGSPTCGSIVMRGRFISEDRIRGTMTAFFEMTDSRQPTGFDTWTFSFRGDRVQNAGSSN